MQHDSSNKNSAPKTYTDGDSAEFERNTQISDSTANKLSPKTFSQLRDELLSTPAGMVGYIEGAIRARRSKSPVSLRPTVLKQLFNHAGKPIPKEIVESKAGHISLSRKELASLVTATAKKAGYGPISRASIYLRTRFG